MRIRKARESDFQAFLALRRNSIIVLAKDYYTPEQLQDWADFASEDKISQLISVGQFFVGEQAALLVCGGSWLEDKIQHFYVDPAKSRQGIGKRLLSYIEQDYRTVTGRTYIEADASLNARRFYESQGYRYIKTDSVENNNIASEYCLLRKTFSSE